MLSIAENASAYWYGLRLPESVKNVHDIESHRMPLLGSEPSCYHPPVYECSHGLDSADVVFRATKVVAVDYDQVGKLADLYGPPGLFSELKIRCPDGPHFERLLAANSLLRVDHLSLASLTGHRRPHIEKRIEGIDCCIFVMTDHVIAAASYVDA